MRLAEARVLRLVLSRDPWIFLVSVEGVTVPVVVGHLMAVGAEAQEVLRRMIPRFSPGNNVSPFERERSPTACASMPSLDEDGSSTSAGIVGRFIGITTPRRAGHPPRLQPMARRPFQLPTLCDSPYGRDIDPVSEDETGLA